MVALVTVVIHSDRHRTRMPDGDEVETTAFNA